MDIKAKASFNDGIVREACHRYGLMTDELSFIGGFQNFIYAFQRNQSAYILRFTPISLRTTAMVEAELEWLLYLSDNGVAVSKPIPSAHGRLVEVVQGADSFFNVVSFDKAPGQKSTYPDCLHDIRLFENCGRITGRMHKLARDFHPLHKRHDWTYNDYLLNRTSFIPASQAAVHDSCNRLMDDLKNLSHNADSYGLIHGDINVGNFTVNDGAITMFDFDECQYSWFVEDIAIQLYYMVYVYGDDSIPERMLQCQRFMEPFMKGYLLESHISDSEWRQIPLFLRLREIIVYTGMHRSFDMSKLDQWTTDFLTQSRIRIENEIPIIEGYF
ncbi:phosphotransferase enzyme family protein [Paenibacillus solisilvae]|uniref:Phosphotransferase enzyme family protein n=1 Tax=Paenibacillus solisilvae TaxID=2486751 RepID=A0ABW0VXV6_9BACL